jgi:hypothetical protein
MEADAELLFEEVDLFDTALIQGNCTNVTFGSSDLALDDTTPTEAVVAEPTSAN